MMKATQKEAVAVTAVFWDIKTCPVPPGFDARRVGPCIKRFLENLGYSGPLTISAIGRLKDVPHEVLRALSSTGIVLDIFPFDCYSHGLSSRVFAWVDENPPPANIMIIADPTDKSLCLDMHMLQHHVGCNILKPYPYGPLQKAASTKAECVWENFLLAESRALEEDKCIDTGACWVCSVCWDYPPGQGFENFTRHLSSEEHEQGMLSWLPSKFDSPSVCHEHEDLPVEPGETWEWFPPRHSHIILGEFPLAEVEAPVAFSSGECYYHGRKQPKRKCKKLRT